jgi:hypothetical protein
MPKDLPYLASYKNLPKLFQAIATAKVPDAFTHGFLYETLGLKGTGDRPLIPYLKKLGFLDPAGKPTSSYALLKNPGTARSAIGEAMKAAYQPLFSANEKAYELPMDQLKGLIAQVAGTDADMTGAIAYTFNALAKLADFAGAKGRPESKEGTEEEGQEQATEEAKSGEKQKGKFRPEFHYNIQVHLPSNGTEETYLNIFNALRKALQ